MGARFRRAPFFYPERGVAICSQLYLVLSELKLGGQSCNAVRKHVSPGDSPGSSAHGHKVWRGPGPLTILPNGFARPATLMRGFPFAQARARAKMVSPTPEPGAGSALTLEM